MRLRTRSGRRVLAFAVTITLALAGTAAAPAHAQTYTVLHSFGSGTDGATPGTVVASEGVLTGITGYGGQYNDGTVFSLDLSTGAESVAYSFNGYGTDPDSIQSTGLSGNFGTTYAGGAQSYGTVFEITRGEFKTVYNFCSATQCSDGSYPTGIGPATSWGLYGVTQQGGAHGLGTIFSLNSATGVNTVAHSFAGGTDGSLPSGDLANNNASALLYGTTNEGGAHNAGTLFSVNASTGAETILYSFGGSLDAEYPSNGLYQRPSASVVYGTSQFGGVYGYGTLFEVTTAGKETVLYSFTGGADGAYPSGVPTQDGSGNLYGTALSGGNGNGTLFELTAEGVFTVLHTFCSEANCADGASPGGALAETVAAIYGVTGLGGAYDKGVAFEWQLPAQ